MGKFRIRDYSDGNKHGRPGEAGQECGRQDGRIIAIAAKDAVIFCCLLELQRRRPDEFVLDRIRFELPTRSDPSIDRFRAAQGFRRLAKDLFVGVDQRQAPHDLEGLKGSQRSRV